VIAFGPRAGVVDPELVFDSKGLVLGSESAKIIGFFEIGSDLA
jgi:hypothetical protein